MHQKIQRKQKQIDQKKMQGLCKGFFAFTFVCFVLSIGFYLLSINTLASKGTEMRAIEDRIMDLSSQNKQLQIEETELKSLHQIEKMTKELGMSKPGNIQYIKEAGPVAFLK